MYTYDACKNVSIARIVSSAAKTGFGLQRVQHSKHILLGGRDTSLNKHIRSLIRIHTKRWGRMLEFDKYVVRETPLQVACQKKHVPQSKLSPSSTNLVSRV